MSTDVMCKTCGIVHKKADEHDEEPLPTGPMTLEDCFKVREEALATRCRKQTAGCTGRVELVWDAVLRDTL